MINRTVGTGGLLMMLLLALAALGVGIALWSKVLTIQGVVRTGSVNAEFIRAFTDDDDAVDNTGYDSQDTGNCEISVGPDTAPTGFPNKDPNDGVTSCDPSATGRDPKPHYDKDVGRCDAAVVPDGQDDEPQPGSQLARVALTNVYPSYHCTAWFAFQNSGTIPVHLHSAVVAGTAALPCQQGSTSYDLNADTQPDVEICLSGFDCIPNTAGDNECAEPQIHPDDVFVMDLDIHVLQTADQATGYAFDAKVCMHQWNEETGNCPDAAHDSIIDTDGFASATAGALKEVAYGDALKAFPIAGGASNPGRCGLDVFDQDNSGTWTNGDDLHCESTQCPTGIPNAFHELGADCKVLDLNNSLVDGEPVNCDLDGYIADPVGAAPGSVCPAKVKWHDTDGDSTYDSGEDIVYDGNNDNIYN
jgi:hypothetical protein